MHDPTATDDPTTTDEQASRPGTRIRAAIRRHAEVLRHPDGFPPRLVFGALAYLHAAYALGGRGTRAELAPHLRRCRGTTPRSTEMALALARGFQRLADEPS